ncbi:MAG: histidine kinase [Sphaerochaetaceae bacterium]|nr:histidine kinase [Sphaerochaetaceae bacterium]MDC7237946.1 histidine kinase [Sphaerochaetaceae bacterium]MDC7249597.1 histidine kinase [Sphaerochaetaceae bacterium]
MKKIKTTLFTRLFIYFFILISIPLISFSIVSSTLAKKKVIDGLKLNLNILSEIQSNKLEEVFEEYRHKIYSLSKDSLIIELLENPNLINDQEYSAKAYNLLFSTMKGDIYKASAMVTSIDGNIKLSTHAFPKDYDLRNHSTILDIVEPLMDSKPFSYTKIISNDNLNTEDDVSITMIRYIFDENQNVLGFVILDIYESTIKHIDENKSLSTSILIDTDSFVASELDNASEYYSFNNFPGLLIREKGKFKETIYNDNNYVLSLNQIGTTSFYVANYIENQTFNENLQQIIIINIFAILFGLVVALIVTYFLAQQITKPIHKLIKGMKRVEQGNLAIDIEENSIYEMQQLNESFNNMVIQIVNLLQTTKESQKRIFEAEREALQSQINPHFLFNTLNTIKSLAKINNQEEIYTISIKLGHLLRSSIYNDSPDCTLEKSLELVKSYLTIQQIRFQDKLHVNYDIDESILSTTTPKLLLQPIVENAIVHGLEPKIGQWYISISIKQNSANIIIEITDNGIGFKNKEVMNNLNLLEKSNHVGLFNVYKRLQLFYKNQASITFSDIKPCGTKATIIIPKYYSLTQGGMDEF